MSELTVILKDSESTYKHKFLCYEKYTMDAKDPYIAECVGIAQNICKFTPDSVVLKVTMVC